MCLNVRLIMICVIEHDMLLECENLFVMIVLCVMMVKLGLSVTHCQCQHIFRCSQFSLESCPNVSLFYLNIIF